MAKVRSEDSPPYIVDDGNERHIVRAYAESIFKLDTNGIHGIAHWGRVERNGLNLAKVTGADPRVITLFAYLHDSCRLNDHSDPDHGPRAADLVETINGELFTLSERQLFELTEACRYHSDGLIKHESMTVLTCWDADRLDLPRIGITPIKKMLCTSPAKQSV